MLEEKVVNLELGRAKVRVQISEYKGVQRLDIRHLFEKDGELLPTQKGVNIPVEFLPQLTQAIQEVYGA